MRRSTPRLSWCWAISGSCDIRRIIPPPMRIDIRTPSLPRDGPDSSALLALLALLAVVVLVQLLGLDLLARLRHRLGLLGLAAALRRRGRCAARRPTPSPDRDARLLDQP